MLASRPLLAPDELFSNLYDCYQKIDPSKYCDKFEIDKKYSESKDLFEISLKSYTDNQLLVFCLKNLATGNGDKINGLWLALWLNGNTSWRIFDLIREKIIEFPASLFDQLDVNAVGRFKLNSTRAMRITALEMLVKYIPIIKRIAAWPDEKLLTLCVEGYGLEVFSDYSKFSKRKADAFFLSLSAHYDHEFHDRTFKDANEELHFQMNLLRFFHLSSNSKNDSDYRASSDTSWAYLFRILKQLKACVANGNQVANMRDSHNERFSEICKDVSVNIHCFLLAAFIRMILPAATPILPIEMTLLNKITPGSSSHPKYDAAIQLYHQSQSTLTEYYFIQTHTSLVDKLLALQNAFTCALNAWLSNVSSDTRLIFRVAQAYLYSSSKFLNGKVGTIDPSMNEFGWLREEMDKILKDPPAITDRAKISHITESLFSILSNQRANATQMHDQIMELKSENIQIRIENAELKQEIDMMIDRVSNLEIQIKKLMRIASANIEAAEKSDQPNETYAPTLFS